jgi:hypothetical protein
VDADIALYDSRGNTIEGGNINYTIYAVSNRDPGISPGETYQEPSDEGFILDPDLAKAARNVEVTITEVVETDAF